jgi:L-lactate dehydrogenase complex protein LldG
MTRDGRESIVDSIRTALGGARLPDAAPSHPPSFGGYPAAPSAGDSALVGRFRQELEAQQGVMHLAADDADAARIALSILEAHGPGPVLSWSDRWVGCPGLLMTLESAGIKVVHVPSVSGDAARRVAFDMIEPIAVGLTGALAGLADTGSLVLASGPGRSRLSSQLPPIHIAVLRQVRLFATLPAFLAANPGVATIGSNVVLVTGPSRTADIEMSLTHGVHGPREVHVIVVP